MNFINIFKKKEVQVTDWLKPFLETGSSCYGDNISNMDWMYKELIRIGNRAYIKSRKGNKEWAIFKRIA